jgi:hypothetical protein
MAEKWVHVEVLVHLDVVEEPIRRQLAIPIAGWNTYGGMRIPVIRVGWNYQTSKLAPITELPPRIQYGNKEDEVMDILSVKVIDEPTERMSRYDTLFSLAVNKDVRPYRRARV